jgi:hypothetical protein
MPRSVLNLFLSSTFEDLRDYRTAVVGALAGLRQVTIYAESWGATPSRPLSACREEVHGCDALIVVVGHRYGWVPSEAEGGQEGKSITWLEVEWALEASKPVYAFLVDPRAQWTGPREQDALLSAATESDGVAVWRRVRSLQAFRAFLETKVTRDFFDGTAKLAERVTTSLFRLVLEHEVAQALAAVRKAPLPVPPPPPPPAPAKAPVPEPAPGPSAVATGPPPAAFRFTAARDQAVVVGSDVVLFAKGLAAPQRSDIANALLLAQLAKKTVPEPRTLDDVLTWYAEYVDVLSSIGFAFEQDGFERITGDRGGVDLHQVVADVASLTLDPAALAFVGRTLESLRSLPADSPKLSLFAVNAAEHTAHFQLVLVEPDGPDGLRLRTLAFGVQTASAVQQILFFKAAKSVTALLRGSATVTVNANVLTAVRDAIAARLATHVDANVVGLDVD